MRPYTYVLLRRFYFANANLNALLGLWENNASRFWSKVFKNTNEIFIGNIEPISAFILQRDEESGRRIRKTEEIFPLSSLPPPTEVRWDGVCGRRASTTGCIQHHSFKPSVTEPQWPEIRQFFLQNITAPEKLFNFSWTDVDITEKLIIYFTKQKAVFVFTMTRILVWCHGINANVYVELSWWGNINKMDSGLVHEIRYETSPY